MNFNKIKKEELQKYLSENYNLKDISESMIEIFQGSIGKAIKLKDKQEEYEQLEMLINKIEQIDLIELLNLSQVLYQSKDEIDEILEYINITLLRKAKQNYLYTNCIEIVENTKKRLKQNANYDMSIDNMLFNMWEEIN